MTLHPLAPRLVAAHDGPTYRVIADLVTFKATGEDTGDAYALFESCTLPAMGVPLHRQRYEDETFFVIEGTYSFQIGDRRLELRTGDYAFVPRGTVHGFTNSGPTPARLLILVSPGGIHEQFFAEAGELVANIADELVPPDAPDLAWLTAIAAKYGVEILP